jgi:hypothetical protein
MATVMIAAIRAQSGHIAVGGRARRVSLRTAEEPLHRFPGAVTVIGYPSSPRRDLLPAVGHLAVHCFSVRPAQREGERLEFRVLPVCLFSWQGDLHRRKHLHVPSQKRAQQFSDAHVMSLIVLDRRKDLR